jgi:hypothetical protein
MIEFYSENGITPCHYPIHDFNEGDLKEKLFRGA